MINRILDSLVGSEISSGLCQKLEDILLDRLNLAVNALHRLQDPCNPEDLIIPQFINLMNCDSFAKVRQNCVENVACSRDVIGHIIARARDVDISEKRCLILAGFLDKSEKVKSFVSTFVIKSWLEHYQNNILEFLKSIRLDADEKDIEITLDLYEHILGAFFKDKPLTELSRVLPINKNRLIEIEDLNWESAAYWRIYAEFLNKNDLEEELEAVLPEFVYFSQYLKEYYTQFRKEVTAVEFLQQQFIIKQFFLLIKTYDFADVSNRRHLNALVSHILDKAVLMSDVTEAVVTTLEYSIPNIDSRCQFISEIISEIMYPMNSEECQRQVEEREFQLSQIRVKLNCLLEEQSEAVRQEDYMEAERIKHEIEAAHADLKNLKDAQISPQHQIQKRTDIPTILKYLDVAAALLLSPQVTKLQASLIALKDEVIQELLIHDSDNVRVKAMRCYALFCIVDKQCAMTGIHIFCTPIFAYQNGEECDTQTLLLCIAAVVDLLRTYGSQLMATPINEGISESMAEANEKGNFLTDLIQGLVDLMDDEQYEIQERAAWGLCQLILSDRIHSPSLISRLVLKWCNPVSEDGDGQRLRQFIGYTLERIPSITGNSVQLEEAVLMTIKVLAYAPRVSPLAAVNIENIAKFMLALWSSYPYKPGYNNYF
ncbi:hypothetical protein NQ318_010085 [Aromia moschata]|uniref:Nuclear condensin complex subunit 3 C-terminal domain-containing protein n=1 Tax=Aromia moschata TaxID=1265417 RepID=A0AAV8Y9E0_9CUCU|nr:hypothetical protein NQ318_010085 [Aromia moschata]